MRGRRGAPSLLPAAQPSAGAAAAGDGLWERQPVLLAVVEPTHPSPAELSTASDGSWRGPEQPHCSQRTPRPCIRGGEDDAFAPELPTHLPPPKPLPAHIRALAELFQLPPTPAASRRGLSGVGRLSRAGSAVAQDPSTKALDRAF